MYKAYIRLQRFAYDFKRAEQRWKQDGTSVSDNNGKQKFYCLAQFPYPSGSIHLGHARVYFISDSIARYQRRIGKNVLHPMGWDSFGLPAENAAIQRNISAEVWTQNNIKEMKEQLLSLGLSLDWDRELATHKQQYYKWTQYLFLLMYKRGLTYKKQAEVNWDPIDKTVLANEQVDSNGFSWRSGAKVQKKLLNQWFFKITNYSDRLLSGLDDLPWPTKVKQMQRGWIGVKNGTQIKFKVKQYEQDKNKKTIGVFIQNIDNLVNCKFIVVPSNVEKSAKIGVCINPITLEEVPIINVKQPIYQDVEAFAALPIIDSKRAILAQQFKIDYKNQSQVKSSINQQDCTKKRIMLLKDWLVSRQRYWGTPIPIINCKKCGSIPSKLPVTLPKTDSIAINPLTLDNYKQCKCPNCLGIAERQSDTLDTFVDSSWYYLRYLDLHNNSQIISKNKTKWMGVDTYVGGIQHAIMHLLYSRFVYKVLYDEGIVKQQQPFYRLIDQGLVKGKTFKLASNNKYIPLDEIYKYKTEQLVQTFEKMSKSKYNGISPITLTEKYGSDALRLALFSVPYDKDIDFTEAQVKHKSDFMNRVFDILPKIRQYQPKNIVNDQQILNCINKLLKDIQSLMQKYSLHVYQARVMQIFNLLKEQIELKFISRQNIHSIFNIFINVLYPICPHLSLQLHNQTDFMNITKQWPKPLTISQNIQIQVFISVDGKFVKSIKLNQNIIDNQPELLAIIKQDAKINKKVSIIKSIFRKNTEKGIILNFICK